MVLLGEDIGLHGGAFTTTAGLFQEFGGERVRNTPISESTIVGAAVGAALTGLRPVAEIMYVDFMALAMDQVVNQAAMIPFMLGGKAEVPMVIRTQGGAGRGNAAQHSKSLEAWFCHVPGLLVAQPSTPYDVKGLLKTAIRVNQPVIFLEHKLLYRRRGEVPEEEYLIPLGEADIKRPGKDVTLIATSRMVHFALEAAEQLAQEGIDVEVIDPRTLVPLDFGTILGSVKRTKRAVVVHEAIRRGGYGAEIAATIMEEAFDYLDAPVLRVAGRNLPIPYAAELERETVPSVQSIAETVRSLF